MSTGKIVMGVLAGIAAGTVIGVLIAPDKGTETRRKIRQRGEDLVDNVKEGTDSMVDPKKTATCNSFHQCIVCNDGQ